MNQTKTADHTTCGNCPSVTRPFFQFFKVGPGSEVITVVQYPEFVLPPSPLSLILCTVTKGTHYQEMLMKTLKQLTEIYHSNFALFILPAVCYQRSLLEWGIALIVIGVLALVVAVVIIIRTLFSYTWKSESYKSH